MATSAGLVVTLEANPPHGVPHLSGRKKGTFFDMTHSTSGWSVGCPGTLELLANFAESERWHKKCPNKRCCEKAKLCD